jgi:serine/threonine protein kinase/tetratricopeptide (TPR) repeat protein
MDRLDWEAVKQVFEGARDLDGPAREAYVARACAGAPERAARVRSLLEADAQATGTFLSPSRLGLRPAWLFSEGTRVGGRFRIVRPIARGAMGEVYEAEDERLRLRVALKTLRPELLSDPESIERFRREVLITRDIPHEHICRVFDLVEHTLPADDAFPDGAVLPCLTMQLLQGESLETWGERHRPASPAEVLPLIEQIASALQSLHDAGIVHRDLKPSNVMLVEDGARPRAVLTDFGLARPIEARVFETQRAVHGGAPYFMAPELLRGERPSPASDIYALGLLVDELVTERPAFTSGALTGLLLQKLQEGPEPPIRRAPGLPEAWDRAILWCLVADPRQRPPDARAFVDVLSGRATAPAVPAVAARRRRRLPQVATGAVAVLTGSALAFTAPMAPPPSSLLVMPFANETGNREYDYLASQAGAGFAKRLEQMPDLLVFLSRERNPTVARDKQAQFMLSGQLRQKGTGLRVVAQVSTGTRDRVLLSREYDLRDTQLLPVETALATDTVDVMRRTRRAASPGWLARIGFRDWLGSPGRATTPPQGTSNAEAYDMYQRARALAEERTLGPVRAAEALYLKAAEKDPQFAAPHAALADLQAILMELQVAPHDVLLREAEAHAARAVSLAPDLADAHLSFAAVLQMQGQWEEAEREFKRSLELHPKFARAHRWYAGLLLQFNRLAESYALFERGLALDPYDIPSQSAYGLALFYGRRPADAARHLEGLLAQRDFMPGHLVLGQSYAYLGGHAAEGREDYLQRALRESARLHAYRTDAAQHYGDLVGGLAWSYHRNPEQAAPYIERLVQAWRTGGKSSSYAARVLAVQGRAEEAMEALLEAERHNDRELMYLAVSPHYDALRNRTDFAELLKRLGLTLPRRP